jgi:hypothetical protein
MAEENPDSEDSPKEKIKHTKGVELRNIKILV